MNSRESRQEKSKQRAIEHRRKLSGFRRVVILENPAPEPIEEALVENQLNNSQPPELEEAKNLLPRREEILSTETSEQLPPLIENSLDIEEPESLLTNTSCNQQGADVSGSAQEDPCQEEIEIFIHGDEFSTDQLFVSRFERQLKNHCGSKKSQEPTSCRRNARTRRTHRRSKRHDKRYGDATTAKSSTVCRPASKYSSSSRGPATRAATTTIGQSR
jgi:hypothetical protein